MMNNMISGLVNDKKQQVHVIVWVKILGNDH